MEDQYDRNGNYYKCKECFKYTLHYKNDIFCENTKCPSNKEEETIGSATLKQIWPSNMWTAPKPLEIPEDEEEKEADLST